MRMLSADDSMLSAPRARRNQHCQLGMILYFWILRENRFFLIHSIVVA